MFKKKTLRTNFSRKKQLKKMFSSFDNCFWRWIIFETWSFIHSWWNALKSSLQSKPSSHCHQHNHPNQPTNSKVLYMNTNWSYEKVQIKLLRYIRCKDVKPVKFWEGQQYILIFIPYSSSSPIYNMKPRTQQIWATHMRKYEEFRRDSWFLPRLWPRRHSRFITSEGLTKRFTCKNDKGSAEQIITFDFTLQTLSCYCWNRTTRYILKEVRASIILMSTGILTFPVKRS